MIKPDWNKYYQQEHIVKRFLPDEDPYEELRVEMVKSLLKNVEGVSSILDVGCGDGYLCHVFRKELGQTVVGVDISYERMRFARANFPGVEYIQGRVYDLPIKKRTFDLVTLIEVLEHLENPSQAIAELRRVSRTYILITVPYKRKLKKILCPHCFNAFNIDGHIQCFDEPRLLELCERNNIILVNFRKQYISSTWEKRSIFRHLPLSVKNQFKSLLVKTRFMRPQKPKYLGILGRIE